MSTQETWRKHTEASKRRSPLLISKVCAFYKESNKVSQLGGFLSPPQTVCLGKPKRNICLRLSFILRQYKVSSKDESQAQGGAESCLRGSQQDPQIMKIKMGINSILCIDTGEFSAVLHYFDRKGTEEGALSIRNGVKGACSVYSIIWDTVLSHCRPLLRPTEYRQSKIFFKGNRSQTIYWENPPADCIDFWVLSLCGEVERHCGWLLRKQ